MTRFENPAQLPPEMYRGGFERSADVVEMLRNIYGLQAPTTIYYPGSSTDVSLLSVDDARVIHVDPELSPGAIAGFEALGGEAYAANAEVWRPPVPVDMIAFINPTGINEGKVLSRTDISLDGLVLWYAWSGRPWALHGAIGLSLVSAVTFTEDDKFMLQTQDLQDYFDLKPFDDLDEAEQTEFIAKFSRHYALMDGATYADAYYQLQRPEFSTYAMRIGIWSFPYKKAANCFVYQKQA